MDLLGKAKKMIRMQLGSVRWGTSVSQRTLIQNLCSHWPFENREDVISQALEEMTEEGDIVEEEGKLRLNSLFLLVRGAMDIR